MFLRRVIFFLTICFLLVALKSYSYDNFIIHPSLSQAAVELYSRQIGANLTGQEKVWIIQGAIAEDADPRYLNHFFDPSSGQGLNDGIFKGIAAKDWAFKQNSVSGDYSVSAIFNNYKNEDYLRAYQGIGHILHLIQDMSVPAHTRNDAHPSGDPYEEWAKKNGNTNSVAAQYVRINSLEQVFNELAIYSHNNFLSEDTATIDKVDNYKVVDLQVRGKKRRYIVNNINGKEYKLVYSNNFDSLIPVFEVSEDIALHQDYWNMLYPKAVGYSAGVIDYFLKEFRRIDKEREEERQKIGFFKSVLNLIGNAFDDVKYVIGDNIIASHQIANKTIAAYQAGKITYEDLVASQAITAEEAIKQSRDAFGKVLGVITAEDLFLLQLAGAGDEEGVADNVPLEEKIILAEDQPEILIKEMKENQELADPGEESKQSEDSNAEFIGDNGEKIGPGDLNELGQISSSNPVLVTGKDNVAPDTIIYTAASQLATSSDISLALSSSEENVNYSYRLDGGLWCDCGQNLNLADVPDGEHTLEVKASDRNKNEDPSPAVFSWIIDTTAPVPAIENGPALHLSTSTAHFRFVADDLEANFEYSLDGSDWLATESDLTITGLVEGGHKLEFRARDRAENVSNPVAYDWIIDMAADTLEIIISPKSYASSTEALFNFFSDEESIFEYRLDGGTLAITGTSTSFVDLNEGEHKLEVRTIDQAGNASDFIEHNWLVDITAPTARVFDLDSEYEAVGFAVSWEGEDTASSTASTTVSGIVSYDVQYRACVPPCPDPEEDDWQNWLAATTSTSVVYSLETVDGNNIYFRARARDAAGNLGEWSSKKQTNLNSYIAGYIVISEVQIEGVTAKDEFIELYNPTNNPINLSGYRLSRKTASGNEHNLLTNFSDFNLLSHSYFLITHPSGYDGTVASNAVYSTSQSIANDNVIILYSDAGVTLVDEIGFGGVSDYGEEAYSVNPEANFSLERKAAASSTAITMNAGGIHYLGGNSYDSDNNDNDFILKESADPQSSFSPPEPREEIITMPGAISDLAVQHIYTSNNSIKLFWRSPANANLGQGAFYNLRYQEKNEDCKLNIEWIGATPVATSSLPMPASFANQKQEVVIDGLASGTEYCFAIMIYNSEFWSEISNQVSVATKNNNNVSDLTRPEVGWDTKLITQTLTVENSPYYFGDYDTILPSDTVLTIEPGVVIKFDNEYHGQKALFFINGQIIAEGTEDNPIIFTSIFDDSYGGDSDGDGGAIAPRAGDWGSWQINGGDNIIDHVIIKYGGADSRGLVTFYSNNSSQITNSIFTDNTRGIEIRAASSSNPIVIENNVFKNIANAAINVYETANPIIRYNDISGNNSAVGVHNQATPTINYNNIYDNIVLGIATGPSYSLTELVDARYNWWGSESGPTHIDNPEGAGEVVTDKVDYSEWLTSPY